VTRLDNYLAGTIKTTSPIAARAPPVIWEAAMAKKIDRRECVDCGENLPGALIYGCEIRGDVWKAAGMEPMDGCLCVGCFKKRVGRAMTSSDLVPRRPTK
jgi:hypothetical protein